MLFLIIFRKGIVLFSAYTKHAVVLIFFYIKLNGNLNKPSNPNCTKKYM